mgnify:CR=1 FL=1
MRDLAISLVLLSLAELLSLWESKGTFILVLLVLVGNRVPHSLVDLLLIVVLQEGIG